MVTCDDELGVEQASVLLEAVVVDPARLGVHLQSERPDSTADKLTF